MDRVQPGPRHGHRRQAGHPAGPLPPHLPVRGDLGRRRGRAGRGCSTASSSSAAGRAFALYVMAYTVGRCWIEMLRIDEANRLLRRPAQRVHLDRRVPGGAGLLPAGPGPPGVRGADRRAGERAAAGGGRATCPRSTFPTSAEAERRSRRRRTSWSARNGSGVPAHRSADRTILTARGRRGPDDAQPPEPATRTTRYPTAAVRLESSLHRRSADPRPRRRAGGDAHGRCGWSGHGRAAIAGALARAGWQVTLLERGERVAAPPTALVLWPNGRRALRVAGPGRRLVRHRRPAARRRRPPPGRPVAGPAPAARPGSRARRPPSCTWRTCTTRWWPGWVTAWRSVPASL